MIEAIRPSAEYREKDPNRKMNVNIVGPANSGKSTLLRELRDRGYTIDQEPENPFFPLFLASPKKFAFQNQLQKTTQLMQRELLTGVYKNLSDPHFRESGVLATEIYNRYLHDQNLMTDEQFDHIHWLYENHLTSFPTPDLVVYLYASDDEIKKRAIKRDGLLAHDPHELQPYWDKLLDELHVRGIPVLKINTGTHKLQETTTLVLDETKRMKKLETAQSKPVSRSLLQHSLL